MDLKTAELLDPIIIGKLKSHSQRTKDKISKSRKGKGRPCKLVDVADQIVYQRNNGMSLRELAVRWETSTSTILRAIKLGSDQISN